MHSCIHAYIHTNMHTYINTCMHAYIHTTETTYAHTYMHKTTESKERKRRNGAQIHTQERHTYIHTYIHTHLHTYTLTYIHTVWHACIHTLTYINTYVHTYIHTYMHTQKANGENIQFVIKIVRSLHPRESHGRVTVTKEGSAKKNTAVNTSDIDLMITLPLRSALQRRTLPFTLVTLT